jgi:hypothetical protein
LAAVVNRVAGPMVAARAGPPISARLGVPTWVMRPLLEEVRAAAQLATRHIRRFSDVGPPPLRTTVHAGEDFAHVLTGLRHIDEAVELLQLREGDRLGHAVALGLNPGAWAARSGRVAMPLEDRLLDLSWEWTWWTQRGVGADAARLSYVSRSIRDLGERLFGEPVTPLQIEQLRNDLADTDRLRTAGFPDRPRRPDRALPQGRRYDRQRRLEQYLQDRAIFRRGRTTLWIDATGEVDALLEISASLRSEVGRRGVAVEINPTSNLLIGDLGDLQGHPLWRLAPPRPVKELPPLAITVGSDDPLVFNSSLPTEYQLLFDTLVIAGLTDFEALGWLDKVRRTGLERRFTAPLPPDEVFGLYNPTPPPLPRL